MMSTGGGGACSDPLLHQTSKNYCPPSLPPATAAARPPEGLRTTRTMKLNVKNIRYLAADDWRVLTAVCARTPRLRLVVGEDKR